MRAILEDLAYAINKLNDKVNIKSINSDAKEISKRYRANKNDGNRLLTKENEAISYVLSRMPATYQAAKTCLSKAFEYNKVDINTVLDVGAGTGTATWAVLDVLGKKDFFCFERERAMINTAKELMQEQSVLKNATWKSFDITTDEIEGNFDLIIASYMINELSIENIEKAVEKLWYSTNKVLLIIEPGTPHGFSNIKHIREYLLKKNGSILAPCSSKEECPLTKDDWCSFSCRVQRTKTHKILKDGEASFEDEKFSYIAFSKEGVDIKENRILRHPIINKGYAEFKICTKSGIKTIKLSKKDGEIYKAAKKKNAGDILNLN